MLDSLVRVSRRVSWNHYASILGSRRGPRPRQPHAAKGYNAPKSHVPQAFLRRAEPMLARPRASAPSRSSDDRSGPRADYQAVPFQQFHVLFHSLFKVLFIFRLLYLFPIGLLPVFSLR